MWVKVLFKNIPLTILIDYGSTHNFIDPIIAKQDDCFIYPCSIFDVMISIEGTLPWKGKFHSVWISIGDYNLHCKMFSLPLGGCDVVLGSQWLPTLGPILWDFAKLWMQFLVNGKKHTLRDYNQGLLASSVHIPWKRSLRIIHMVSSISSISFICNLQQSQLLPWIYNKFWIDVHVFLLSQWDFYLQD